MTTSTTQLWGRAWKLTVTSATQGGSTRTDVITSDSWDPEALRATFDVCQTTLPSPFWFAEISIFNMNTPAMQNLLMNAIAVTLEAGYQYGPTKSSVIWDGPVLQTLFDRENVVDQKITFNCIASIPLLNETLLNFSTGPFSSQAQIVERMIAEVGNGFDVDRSATAQSKLEAKQFPRGKSIFGRANRYLFQMADDNYLSSWMNGAKVAMSEMDAGTGEPDVIYGPPLAPGYAAGSIDKSITRSVLGVPVQTPFGVNFKVLLDPRVSVKVPPMLVQLDRAVIRQAKVQYGQIQTPLDPNLVFVAAQVRHTGDTRGDQWETEISGYTRTYAQGLLNGIYLPNSGASQ